MHYDRSMNGYNNGANDNFEAKLIESIDSSKNIKFIGNFTSLTTDELIKYIDSSSVGYIIVGKACRLSYNNSQTIRYVAVVGYNSQNNQELVGRDPLLHQMRFSMNDDFVVDNDWWIYSVS